MFEKNQAVVCIDDNFHPAFSELYLDFPIKGNIYHIRDVVLRRSNINGPSQPTYAVLLVEITNPPDPATDGTEELAYRIERFAPIEELRTSEEAKDSIPVPIRRIHVPEKTPERTPLVTPGKT